ncbi:PAS domain-containing protein [Halothiobacillus sp.]|uniref:PAS domain-containing protein n=1 Tax=Halothiobacillus sp. TaxID=1891311 RepID=UPI002629B499|nr:PAS domain-containing protein [Halothiobacillus sp.]
MLDSELLQKAVEASNDGIVIAEQEGGDNILIYANAAFEHLTGYLRDEILYQDCRFLQGDDRDQAALSEIKSAIKEGRPTRVVVRNYRKDGTLFWNELSITPIFNDKDQLTYFIGIQHDVSELVRLQEENNALKAQLAKISATRSQNSVPTA